MLTRKYSGRHPLHFVFCTMHLIPTGSCQLFGTLIALLTMTNIAVGQIYVADPEEYRFAVPPDEVDLSYSPLGPASLDSAAMERMGEANPDYVNIVRAMSRELLRLKQEKLSWVEAEARVSYLLQRFAANPYLNTLRQEAASTMLWHYLLSDTVTTARQREVGRYTQMLLDSRHPDADLLERALQYLGIEDAWSRERRAAAAEEGAKHARAFLSERDVSLLERVGLGDMPETDELNNLTKKRHARIAAAILRLERMAARLRQ